MFIGFNGENEGECYWTTNHPRHRYHREVFVADLPFLFEDALEDEGEAENGYESRDHAYAKLQKQERKRDHFF